MKTRCPACGSENSLDALLSGDDARQALWSLAQIGGELTKRLVQYLGLFRPVKSSLSNARMAKLLAELLPDIQSGRIVRDGQEFDAPIEAWIWALGEVLNARDLGTLKTPMKAHGYLYEVLTHWRGVSAQVVQAPASKPSLNKLVEGLARLEGMK